MKDIKTISKQTERFYKRNKKTIDVVLVLLLLIIPLFYAGVLRTTPYRLPITEDWAAQSVDNNYRTQIGNQLRQQFPNLPQQQLTNEINKQYDEFYAANEAQLQAQKDQLAEQYKSRLQADNGQTYLLAIDSYFFYTASQNYFFNGHTGDTTVINEEGQEEYYKKKQLAPIGSRATDSPELHIRIEKAAFDLAGITEASTPGEKIKAIYFIPVLFSILASVGVFFAVKTFSNSLYGFFAAMLFSTIGTVLSRTIAGFVDTDVYNIFFPSIAIMFVLLAIYHKNKYWQIALGTLSALSVVLYGLAWQSWYLFLIILGSLAGVAAYDILQQLLTKRNVAWKKLLSNANNRILLTFAIGTFILSSLINSTSILTQIKYGLSASYGAVATISTTNIWPNVLSSVAELNPASFGQIVGTVGGKFVFLLSVFGVILALLLQDNMLKHKVTKYLIAASAVWLSLFIFNFASIGILNKLHTSLLQTANNSPAGFIILFLLPVFVAIGYSLYTKQQLDHRSVFLTLIFIIWIGGTIFMSFNGVRFILLLAPGFVIAFGYGLYQLQRLAQYLLPYIEVREVKIQKIVATILIIVLFFVIFSPINVQAQAQARGSIPNFDDEWFTAMQNIKAGSNESAIITSWWDFGHYFIAMSDRGATFDGATQGTPRAHWVGKLLLENNEDAAHDILRMLTCGGNEAHHYMLERSNDPTNGILVNKVIYDTLGVPIEDKRGIIEENDYFSFTEEEVDQIMAYLACENPSENFLIASGDMIGKAGVWAHWGSWDFTKKYVFDNYQRKTAATIAQEIDEDEALIQQYMDELQLIDIRARVENIKRQNLLNQWFAPYPNYVPVEGNYFLNCQADNTTILCPSGITINTEDMSASALPQTGISIGRIVFVENNTVEIYDQGNNAVFDVVLIKNGNTYATMLAQTPLGGSLFTRLFYLDGAGVTKFSLFDDRTSVTGNRIRTWSVEW